MVASIHSVLLSFLDGGIHALVVVVVLGGISFITGSLDTCKLGSI